MFNERTTKRIGLIFLPICVLACTLGCLVGWFAPQATPVEVVEAATVESYYDDLNENLTGTAFRAELADLITETHTTETTYSGLISVFPKSDVDPNNSANIIQFYTGYSVKAPTNFNQGTNREHVWPKNAGSAFPAESKAGSDSHHLRPANTNLNSSRGSKNFGEVAQTSSNLVSQSSGSNPCYSTSTYFYPGVGYRGATARILMYVQTRWGDDYSLSFVLGAGSNKTIGDIEDLMKWHIEEPPTEEEYARNEAVYKIQGNRNPFIDHPEYAEMIYCHDGQNYNDELQNVVKTYGSYLEGGSTGGSTTIEPTSISLSKSNINLIAGENASLTATVMPTGSSKSVTWTSSDSNVATVKDGVVTAVSAGTATITATSTVNTSIKATATVNVKAVSSISVAGTPVKTTYYAGETFNPIGLTVTATYTDNTTVTLTNTDCTWLDGTTRTETLAQGSTTVICKYGNLEKTISGITVKQATTKTLTITREDFTGSGAYTWATWTDSGISGQAFMYPGNSSSIQMNSSKDAKYIFNSTALSGGIISISIKNNSQTTSDKTWKILTSTTSFTAASGTPSGGTDRGTLTSTTSGGKLDVNTTDQYFALCYTGSNAVYIDEIVIVYGAQGDACDHVVGDWIIDTPATCTQKGGKHNECEKCGEVVDVVEIPITEHVYSAWAVTSAPTCGESGIETRTCTGCGNAETRDVPALSHTWRAWTVVVEATCEQAGREERSCSGCGEIETKDIEKLGHSMGAWTEINAPTCETAGKESSTCATCGEVEEREIPALGHTSSDWTVTQEPTCSQVGKESCICDTCGQGATRDIPKLDHTFGDWVATGVGKEERTCSECGEKEERVTANVDAIESFEAYVSAIESATTTSEKWEAIKDALEAYDKLTESEKNLVAESYDVLEQQITSYNTMAVAVNKEANKATEQAIMFYAGLMSLLAYAAYFLLKA